MISKRHIFRLALVIAVIIISYLVFSRPHYPQLFSNMDKVGHLGSFFCLSLLTYLAFKPKWYLLTATLSIYAVFIELVQARLPYRSASVADFIADMAGVFLFYFCLWSYQRYFGATKVVGSP
ncbi:VanZ family protein [Shewanella sp.]|uniref:VanZ family protein n=1 Tax=Shewanella sp. TaxID=50422 RepID=UPI001EC263B1|nr:VanZ family protein [Shewanella sp.]NRB25954.1 VanZ family protein [Shewanella sp.]